MGTVQNIVETLKRLNEQKKANLASRYQEHSTWLARELNLIKDLIKQNPRDKISNDATEDENIPVIANSQNKDDNSIRQKRKSPETSIQMSQDDNSQSPEQKRSSGDYTKIENGVLPNDLNKLKKEQLLHELELRGNKSFSMKALKKDLVDALKELLSQGVNNTSNESQSTIAQPQRNTLNTVTECTTSTAITALTNSISSDIASNNTIHPSDNSVNTVENEINDSSMIQNQPQSASKAPQRKGSLMAGIRTLVQSINPVVKAEEESEESKNARLQNEFQARQRRHRDSQARKSQNEFEDLPKEPSSSQDSLSNDVQTSFTDVKSPINSTWMEVASPIPETVISDTETMVKLDKDVSNLEQTFSAVAVETQLSETDSNSDSQSPGSISNEKETEASEINMTQEDHMKHLNTSVDEVTNLIKKPSNLLTGQSSFIDNKGVKKIPIPALESAKLAKAAEEAKQLNRKKELEKKKAAYLSSAQGSNSTSNIVTGASSSASINVGVTAKSLDKPTSAPTATTATGASKIVSLNKPVIGVQVSNNKAPVSVSSAAPVTTSATSAAVPAKKGMFGFFKNTAKPIISSIVGTSNSSTTVTTPVSKPDTKIDSPRDDAFDISACVLKDVPSIPQSTTVTRISSGKAGMEDTLQQETLPQPPLPSQTLTQAPKSPTMIESVAESHQDTIQPVVTKVDNPPAAVVVEAAPIKHIPVVTPATTLRVPEVEENKGNIGNISPAPAAADRPQVLKDITQEQVPEEDEEPISTDQYQIDDRESSDSSGSGTDDEAEQEKQKRIPEWARGPQLKEALERQYGANGHAPIDPDLIFPEVQTCSLEEIFGSKEGKAGQYSKRTSSAKWDHDELTLVEKRTYRTQMGYGNSMARPSAMKMN